MHGVTALVTSFAISNNDAFLSDAVLSARTLVEHQPGTIAVGLFPYGTCMAQLVRQLEGLDPLPGECPEISPNPSTLGELCDAQLAYPLALGAVVRACSPTSSAADFASALAHEDRGCAGAVAWVARHYATGSPAAAAFLGQLSRHPDAAIAAAFSGFRVAVPGSTVGANDGVFPHGLALRQLERAVAGA